MLHVLAKKVLSSSILNQSQCIVLMDTLFRYQPLSVDIEIILTCNFRPPNSSKKSTLIYIIITIIIIIIIIMTIIHAYLILLKQHFNIDVLPICCVS